MLSCSDGETKVNRINQVLKMYVVTSRPHSWASENISRANP